MKQALIVIDVQNDYFENGKYPLYQPEKALDQINRLESYFNNCGLPIIYIQHVNHFKDAKFFEIDTKGVMLHQSLKLTESSIIIEKQYPNSFFQTNLLEVLKEYSVEELIITGMMTHMCIDSTTRAAKEHGFKNYLIQDATATRNLVSNDGDEVGAKHVQLAYLSALMNFSNVLSTDDFLKL